MYLADSHLHTLHSFDSQATMEAQCRAAMAAGFRELCFTEHFSCNPDVPTYGHMDWAAYDADFATCTRRFAGQLTLRQGIEICEPHSLISQYRQLRQEHAFDMVAGSVHNINNRKLRTIVAQEGIAEAHRLYFTEVLRMVQTADMDVVAHFDLIKRYCGQPFTAQDLERSHPLITEALQVMVQRGLALEVNTSELAKLGQTMPADSILALFAALGGRRLTFGSDAHYPQRLGQGFAHAASAAQAAGFEGFCTYAHGQPTLHPFDQP